MKNFFCFLPTLATLFLIPSCAQKERTTYMVSDPKDHTFASPFVKKMISEKNGVILIDKLVAVEESAQKELRRARITASNINREIKKKQKNLKKSTTQQINKIRKEHEKTMRQLRKSLYGKIKDIEKHSTSEINALEVERRIKESKLIDSAKHLAIKKVNQAEMDLLNKYITSKQKSITSPQDSSNIEQWKQEKIKELETDISYLSDLFHDDIELQQMLKDKKSLVETNITNTEYIDDYPYTEVIRTLKPLTTMREVHMTANQLLEKAISQTTISTENKNRIKLIIQSELPEIIQQSMAKNKQIPQDKINDIVIDAIKRIKNSLEYKEDIQEGIVVNDLQKKLSNLESELVKEAKEKKALKDAATLANQKITSINGEKSETTIHLETKLKELKRTLKGQIHQQIELKKLLVSQQRELTTSKLSEQEKTKKIAELQLHLNRSALNRFRTEIEAAKANDMQTQLSALGSSLDGFKTKHQQSQEHLKQARNRIQALQEEKERQRLKFQIKKKSLKREKELLKKRQ